MDRRTVLSTAGLALTGLLAGCTDEPSATEPADEGKHSDDPDADGGTSDPAHERTADTERKIVDTDFQTRGDARDVDAAVADEPTVEADEIAGEIRIEGRYRIGDRCHDEVLPEPQYDEESDTLTVRLSREHDGGDDCELEDQEVPYRILVTVTGTLPSVVEVSKTGGASGEDTRVELG